MAYAAIDRLGIKPDRYIASEIDKWAIKVAKKNWPDIEEIGDVRLIDTSTLPEIDLLIGGSPCTNLSRSGNRLGLAGEQSKLFYEYVRILNEVKPKYFLLENVASMSKESRDTISKCLGVEQIFIDSALVSAQTRKRYYWTNIPVVGLPEDKGILLRDIIESGVVDRDKSYCIDASYYKGTNLEHYISKHVRQVVFDLPHQIGYIKKNQQGRRVYSIDAKAVALKGNGGGWGAKMGL